MVFNPRYNFPTHDWPGTKWQTKSDDKGNFKSTAFVFHRRVYAPNSFSPEKCVPFMKS